MAQKVSGTRGRGGARHDGGLHGNAACRFPHALHDAALCEFDVQEAAPAWRYVTTLTPLAHEIFLYVFLRAALCSSWLTNTYVMYSLSYCAETPPCCVRSSSSTGDPETRSLDRADLFMLTSLCLITEVLMLTGKRTNHELKLLNWQVPLTSIAQLCDMR